MKDHILGEWNQFWNAGVELENIGLGKNTEFSKHSLLNIKSRN